MTFVPRFSSATKLFAEHGRSFVQAELRLAAAELKRKAAAVGIGIGLLAVSIAAGVLALLLAFAAAVAALAIVLATWLALLVGAGAAILVAAVFSVVGVVLVRRGTPPKPEEALEEARLAREALRDE
jgi:Putative Actinobacterial Holin-X, holin superfamily III